MRTPVTHPYIVNAMSGSTAGRLLKDTCSFRDTSSLVVLNDARVLLDDP